jgi:pyruvate/2-oxoglutarate dehydrogenase complex dihydrolipoamide acyltransferase (E2) component
VQSVDVAGGNPSLESGKHLATPAVRRLAKEHNIDLDTVQGSGKGGRLLKVSKALRGIYASEPSLHHHSRFALCTGRFASIH